MTLQNAIENDRKVKRNADLIVASVDDELVMLSVEKGQYFGVTGVGTRIWELLESPCTENDIVGSILREFEVDEATCRNDVRAFLDRMLEMELVVLQ